MVKRETRPIELQSYAELSYQNPLSLAALISFSGFVQILQWRSKASSCSSPKQVWHLEQSLVQLQDSLRQARFLKISNVVQSTKIFRNSDTEWDGMRQTFLKSSFPNTLVTAWDCPVFGEFANIRKLLFHFPLPFTRYPFILQFWITVVLLYQLYQERLHHQTTQDLTNQTDTVYGKSVFRQEITCSLYSK